MASQFIDIGQEYLCTYSKLSHFVPYPLSEFELTLPSNIKSSISKLL